MCGYVRVHRLLARAHHQPGSDFGCEGGYRGPSLSIHAINPPQITSKNVFSSSSLLVECPQEPEVTAGLLRSTRGHYTCGVFFTNCCFHPSTQPPHSPTNVYALHKTAISAKLHQCITKLHRARKETHYVGYMTKLYQLITRTI